MKMISTDLKARAKNAKKLEETIKELELLQKHLAKLERLDFQAFRLISPEKFADELYYDIKHRIEEVKNQLAHS